MSGKWVAHLSGDRWRLEGLGASFAQGRHTVREEAGQYLLTSPDLTLCDPVTEAWSVAERIVNWINRAAKVSEPDFNPVEVQALLQLAPDGAQLRHIVTKPETGRIVLRKRVAMFLTRADGTVETIESSPGPSLARKLVALQEQEGPHSAVARALEQWNLADQTPTSLNNILESIRDDTSGRDPNKGRGWRKMAHLMAPLVGISEPQVNDEMKLCRDSLQDYTAVGPLARHGSRRPIINPMNLTAATEFVRRLLLAWLQSKV